MTVDILKNSMLASPDFDLPPLDFQLKSKENQESQIQKNTEAKSTGADTNTEFKTARKVFLKLHALGFSASVCEKALEETLICCDAENALDHAIKLAVNLSEKQKARNLFRKFILLSV